MRVVVVIPTYNEKENTLRMIDILSSEFAKIKNHEMLLLYVDANSPDGTAQVVRGKMKEYEWLHLLLEEKKEGLGRAYAKGFKYAMDKLKADYVMEFDADFQHRPDEIRRLVEKIDAGYEYIIGSRYIQGGSIPKEWGFSRKFLSVVGNLIARVGLLLPGVHDLTTGFKLTKAEVLRKIDLDHLYSNSFAYKVQIVGQAIQGGAKWVEVPITFMARTKGESKIIKNEMAETLKVIFLVQIHNPKILRFLKFGTVGFIGYLVNAITLELFSKSAVAANLAAAFSFTRGTFVGLATQPSAWAAALATEMAIISNFTLNNLWTFSEVKITKPLQIIWKFIQFNFTSLGAVVIQFIVIGLAVSFFGDTRTVRQIGLLAGMPLVLSFNYVMYNLVIWKTWKLPWQKAKAA